MRKLIDLDMAIDAVIKESNTDGAYGYMDTKSIVDLLNDLPSAQPEPHWIPVTERLPKNDVEVIVSCTDDSGDTSLSYTTVAWHFNGTWICDNERCFFITAWMPLPEPYRAKRRTDE